MGSRAGWKIGPYMGPFISSFMLRSLTWRQSFWVFSGFVGLGLLAVVFVMDETAYDRLTPENNPVRPPSHVQYRLQSLLGVIGNRATGRKSILHGTLELIGVFTQPHFFCLCPFPLTLRPVPRDSRADWEI